MKIGDTIKTSIGYLVLDERVLPDPSARQYEPGWWAFEEGRSEADDPTYFIGDDGVIYANSEQWPNAYDVEVGRV